MIGQQSTEEEEEEKKIDNQFTTQGIIKFCSLTKLEVIIESFIIYPPIYIYIYISNHLLIES